MLLCCGWCFAGDLFHWGRWERSWSEWREVTLQHCSSELPEEVVGLNVWALEKMEIVIFPHRGQIHTQTTKPSCPPNLLKENTCVLLTWELRKKDLPKHPMPPGPFRKPQPQEELEGHASFYFGPENFFLWGAEKQGAGQDRVLKFTFLIGCRAYMA